MHRGTTRRELLKVGFGSAAAIGLSASMPAFVSRMAFAEAGASSKLPDDNILVVVQLSGGNDGLNTVVPLGADPYFKARPNIALKDNLHSLSDEFGLNPGMTAFKQLYEEGHLGVIHGCGYPQPNRSHFRSMEIWHTANPKEYATTGWIGHYIDHKLRGSDNALKAISTGAPVPSVQSLEDFKVKLDPASSFDAKMEEQLIAELNSVQEASPAMQFLARQATNAMIATHEMAKLKAYRQDADYPNGLGQQLRLIAQLISGNFGTRVFYCQTGGYDTHANQVGSHQGLLANVSQSIAAFHKDLTAKKINDKVMVMVFSEFGRRVAQNGSNGTDHGAAGPMFVSGGKVKGGLYGQHPSLTDLDDGDLKYTTDFRRVYATILDRWLNADSTVVLKNKFEPLPLV
jgi:uncharacterized protein (DUF1501 family)